MAPAVVMPSFLVPLLSALAFLLVLGVSWLAYGCCTRKPLITRALDTQGHLIQKNNTSLYNSNKNKHNTLLAGPEYPKSVFGHSYESLSDISEDDIPNPYINDNDDDDEAVYENQSNRGRLDLSFRFPPSRRHQSQTHEATPYNPPATTTSLSPLDTLSPRRPSPNGSTYFPRRARTNTHSRSRSEHHRNQRKNGYTTIQDQDYGQGDGRSKSKPTPKPIPVPTPTHAPAQLGKKKSWWSWFGLRGRRREQFRAGKEYASEGMTTKTMMMATPGKVGIAERGMGMGMQWTKGDSGEEEEEGEEEEACRFRSRSRSRSRILLKTPASASSHSVFYSALSSLASAIPLDPGPGPSPNPEHSPSGMVPRTPHASGSRTSTAAFSHTHAHTPTRTPTSTTTTTSGLNRRKGHVRATSDVDFDLVDHTNDSHSHSEPNSNPHPHSNSNSKNHDHHRTPRSKRQHHRRGQSYVIVQHTPRVEAQDLDASSDGDGDGDVLDRKMDMSQGQDRDRDSMRRPGPDSLTDSPRLGQVQGSAGSHLGVDTDLNGIGMVRGVGGSPSAHHHRHRLQRRHCPGSTPPGLPRPKERNEERSGSRSRGLSLYMSSRRQSRGVDDEERLPSPPPLVNPNVNPSAKRRAKNTHSRSDALVQGVPATILLHKGKEALKSKAKDQGRAAALHHSRAMRITRRYTQPTFTDRTSGVGEAEVDDDEEGDLGQERTQHRQRLDFKRAQTDPTPFPVSVAVSPSRSRGRTPRKNSRSRSRSRGFLGFGSRSRSRSRSGHGDESDEEEEYDNLPPSPTGTPTRASWERTVEWMNMRSSSGVAPPAGRGRGRSGAGGRGRQGTMAQSGVRSEAHERGRQSGWAKSNAGSDSDLEILELEASGVLSAQFITRGGRQVKPGSVHTSQGVEGRGSDPSGEELQDEGDDGWTDTSLSMVMSGRDRDRDCKPAHDETTLIPASFDPSSRSRLDNGPTPAPQPHPRTFTTSSTPIVTTASSPSGTAFYTSTPIEKPKSKLQSKRDRSSPSPSLSPPRVAGAVAVAPSSDSILSLVDKIMLWDGTSLEFPDD